MAAAQVSGTPQIVPSKDEAFSEKTRALGLTNSATPRLLKFEDGVREFLADIRQLTPEQFRERADFAQKDRRFPVFAEFRLNYGDREFGAGSMSSIVKGLATALGYQASLGTKLKSVFSSQTETEEHMQYVYDNSPAIRELAEDVAKYNLKLMIKSGVSYNSVFGDNVLRLLVVLDGTKNVYDLNGHALGDELLTNPALMKRLNVE